MGGPEICERCAHWTALKRDRFTELPPDVSQGECDCEAFVYTGSCERIERNDQFEYCDYEGYSAFFRTGPQFGCVHWTERVAS